MKKLIILSLAYCCITLCGQKNNESPVSDAPISDQEFDQIIYDGTRRYAEIFQLVKQKHYRISNLEQALNKSIDCFLNSLDPHSSFFDPKTYEEMFRVTSGEFFGIGIVIDNTRKSKDKFLIVVDTVPNGPADQAGVKPLDKIIEIDGDALDGMTTEQATTKLKGERNTKVHIKVMRDNQTDVVSFDITRDVIKEQNYMSFYIPDYNIHYLSLTMFTDSAAKQLEQILEQAKKKKYKALILDLRNNSGGLLNSAIDIAGLFLDKESLVVVTKNKNNKVTEQYKTSRNPVADSTIPIFILINNFTASAAEILAGTLKLHSELLAQQGQQKKSLVFLVGTNTFGKGSVQEIIPISNNSALRLTTSLYFISAKGHDVTIQGVGIEPDFIVERCLPPTEQMQWFSKYYGREQMLNNSIKLNNNNNNNNANNNNKTPEKQKQTNRWSERAQEMLQTDNQLRATISFANLLYTFQTTCPEQVATRTKAITFLKQNNITNEQIKIQEIKV